MARPFVRQSLTLRPQCGNAMGFSGHDGDAPIVGKHDETSSTSGIAPPVKR
jgi:hypothetical protein